MQTFLQILASGSIAFGALVGLLKLFGPKWVDHKFNEKLAEFQRKQDEELEKYRFEIQKMFNKAAKVHEREFEILPKIWDLLQRANGGVNQALSPLGTSPDFSKMNDKELEAVISSMSISDIQKENLRKAPDKFQSFGILQRWAKINYAEETSDEFRNYFYLNQLFFTTKLEVEIKSAIDILSEGFVHAKVDQQASQARAMPFAKNLKDVKPVIQAIRKLIQERLRFDDAE